MSQHHPYICSTTSQTVYPMYIYSCVRLCGNEWFQFYHKVLFNVEPKRRGRVDIDSLKLENNPLPPTANQSDLSTHSGRNSTNQTRNSLKLENLSLPEISFDVSAVRKALRSSIAKSSSILKSSRKSSGQRADSVTQLETAKKLPHKNLIEDVVYSK